MTAAQYKLFLREAYGLLGASAQYLSPGEDINCLELAHLIPEVPATMLAIYLAINDAVCGKGLVTEFLPRHGHNNVFVFDQSVFSGGEDVPSGTVDSRLQVAEFEPPNESWDSEWTYVMIADPERPVQSLWREKGYIDMIPAKFEDFTMLTDSRQSKACIFVAPACFEHPVNLARGYLEKARDRGAAMSGEFIMPEPLTGEFDGLEPVVLERGEKLYVATTDYSPCDHGWVNQHPDNRTLAVVNENSAVPLNLASAKPTAATRYAEHLIPPKGSADMTTDRYLRGCRVTRKPLLAGPVKG